MMPPTLMVPSNYNYSSISKYRGCTRGSSPQRLAATVLNIRAQEVRKGCGRGSERRSTPGSFVVEHGVENDEELTHAGDERGLGALAAATQPQIESSDGGIAADSRHCCHIQDAPCLRASAPDTTA